MAQTICKGPSALLDDSHLYAMTTTMFTNCFVELKTSKVLSVACVINEVYIAGPRSWYHLTQERELYMMVLTFHFFYVNGPLSQILSHVVVDQLNVTLISIINVLLRLLLDVL